MFMIVLPGCASKQINEKYATETVGIDKEYISVVDETTEEMSEQSNENNDVLTARSKR